ncbi:peptidylprolyl isomerase [Anaeramoeba ignava]|uniref:Peptidylprolyl isomerase n=1 Tax=Anaeramoeba ignava TaxID=1746090 RepID=A0A9Q0LKB4_ANAIG|nr:peptidylprolyl isomerase [Anaeramoeba ignava]
MESFWAHSFEPNRTYTIKPSIDQRLTTISLGPEAVENSKVRLYYIDGDLEILLCTLYQNKKTTARVDLLFQAEKEFQWRIEGDSMLHLSGYYDPIYLGYQELAKTHSFHYSKY